MFRFSPVSFAEVRIKDFFWSEWQRVNHEQSLPKQYDMCKDSGRIDALRLQWTPDCGKPVPHVFWDSDTAKWLEAACYACQLKPDAKLRARIDEVAALFVSAQQPDGYLNSHFTVTDTDQRWKNLRDDHELYCAGHIIEASVAHHALTGENSMLAMACRLADHIGVVFGTNPGQQRGYCGHEEIELALMRLYQATNDGRRLKLAEYFVNERSLDLNWFESGRKGRNREAQVGPDHYQAHQPVREQMEATGHAVRAMYLYCGMTDVAVATGDEPMLAACRSIWESMTRRKLYVTGGIGSSWEGEKFTGDFDLPNERAYCETCASVALVFWARRMFLAEGDSSYIEVLERTLYNGALAGMSIDGRKFFYQNPLASHGDHHRKEWFKCSCCPSNLSRLLGTLGGDIAARSGDALAVNLYIGSEVDFTLGNGVSGMLRQSGDIPWGGTVRMELSLKAGIASTAWKLLLRVPEWSGSLAVRFNGTDTQWTPDGAGYACLLREWRDGDVVEVKMDMPVRQLTSDPRVFSNAGQVALQRGPFVYCIEDVDFSDHDDDRGGVHTVALPAKEGAALKARFDADLLGGIVVLEGEALKSAMPVGKSGLYQDSGETGKVRPKVRRVPFRAIPYFAWDNREPGAMRVWIPRATGGHDNLPS